MKKYAILTSVLALAACGGGSGGGMVAPARPAISDITGMRASVTNKTKVIEEVESKLGDLDAYATQTTQKKARAAKAGMTLDQKYELAMQLINQAKETLRNLNPAAIDDDNLNNVIMALKLAGQTVSETVDGVRDYISKNTPDDIISNVDKIVSEHTRKIDDATFDIISVSDDGEIEFGGLKIKTDGEHISAIALDYGDEPNGKFTMKPLGGKTFITVTSGGTQKEVHKSKLILLGKEHKLQYADFGYIENTPIVSGESEISREYLTGGYTIMEIEPNEMSGEMTFTGTAVATMWNDATGNYKNLRDDNATLTFNNGSESLEMKFKDWYNVKIKDDTIKFEGDVTDSRFAFTTANDTTKGKFDWGANYYGDGKPEEATANFGYSEGEYIDDDNTTLKGFTGSFGGKINQ